MTRSKTLILATLAAVLTLTMSGQSIRTIAGGGIDDGRPAKEASLSRTPSGIAVDSSGNVFVADTLRHRVRRIDAASGMIATVAGNGSPGFSGDGGPADEAQLDRPTGLALDAEGRLYVADFGNGRIRRVDLARNTIETYAGDPDAGVLGEGVDRLAARIGVSAANGLAVAANGDVYFADQLHHVVRRIASASGAVTTVAGTFEAGYDGDGTATQRRLNGPVGLTLSPGGTSLVVSDRDNLRLRRIDLAAGTMTTIAGDGTPGGDPDGKTGADPLMRWTQGVRYDSSGILHVVGFDDTDAGYAATLVDGVFRTVAGRAGGTAPVDGANPRSVLFRRPQAIAFGSSSQHYVLSGALLLEIATDGNTLQVRAGEGRRVGDGGPALAAILDGPSDVALDGSGRLFVAEEPNVRRVEPGSGIIGSIASIDGTRGVGTDSHGRVYFADGPNGLLYEWSPATGVVRVVAGGGDGVGDRVPARSAKFGSIASVDVAPDDTVYVGDGGRMAVFRFDPVADDITRVAGLGTGEGGTTGDGGPATSARIGRPGALAVGDDGTLFVADQNCNCVRRVQRASGTISTVAGGGASASDGVPATQASFAGIEGLAADAANNLWVSTPGDGRIRYVSQATGLVQTVAGGRVGDGGDGGPATGAAFAEVSGIEVRQDGSIVVADRLSNRVRAIDACGPVAGPALVAPAPGTVVDGSQALFAWAPADGAALYDLYLREEDGADRLIAPGLSGTSHVVRNLAAGASHEWRVIAWGDPYCSPRQSASSAHGGFSTRPSCGTPGFFQLASPPPGQPVPGSTVELSWTPSEGAGRYEVFLGVTAPLVSIGSTRGTTLTVDNLAPASLYLWSVRAYSSCDPSFSRTTDTRDFATSGTCQAPAAPQLLAPVPAGTPVDPKSVVLSWSRAAGAAGYDLYLGHTGESGRLLHNVTGTSVTLTGLDDGSDYTWRIEAFAGCDTSSRTSSETGRFVTRGCTAPDRPIPVVPNHRFAPVGRPYVVAWGEATRGDASRRFVVERSLDEFATVHDRQEVDGTSATFTAEHEGAWSHRVIALGCGGVTPGATSPVMRIVARHASNDVRVLTSPRGTIVPRGAELSGHATSLTLENPGVEPLDLRFVTSSKSGAPFFEMVDTLGGAVTGFRLEGGEVRKFLVRFGGPSTSADASHEGFVAVYRDDGTPLRSPVTAYVSLRVGSGGSVAPDILDAFGQPTGFVSFSASSDPASQESVVTIQLRNPGTEPLDLAAETGPDAWLEPEGGWNESPIPAGASRIVRLHSRRDRAPVGAVPRHSYIRFRAASGEAATLLVADPDGPPLRTGRSGEAAASELSRIVTRVTTRSIGESRTLATTLHLTNGSADDMTVDLTFTPEAGAADPSVLTISVVVPAFDTVSITDPLATWFGRARPATGQLEVRTAPDRFGALTVSAREGVVQDGAATRAIPVVRRGEGAAPGMGRTAVLSELPAGTPRILLVETSGDEAKGRVEVTDVGGVVIASLDITLPRNAYRVLGASDLSVAALVAPFEVFVSGTTGSIYPAILVERDGGAIVVGSEPVPGAAALKSRQAVPEQGGNSLLVPLVVNGRVSADASVTMRTTTTFVATGNSSAQFRVTLVTDGGPQGVANVTVEPRKPRSYGNVFFQLFGKSIERGALLVERLAGSGSVLAIGIDDDATQPWVGELPVVALGENPAEEEPMVLLDGLEQRVEAASGHDWSLHLVETGGAATEVTVSVFESSGPLTPLAQKAVTVGARGRVEIDDLMEWIGLDDPIRQADRPRLLCTVSKQQGGGRVVAAAVSVDRDTGIVQVLPLTPSGGEAHVELASGIIVVDGAQRQHPVRR